MNNLIYATVYFEHAQVIRSDNKPESVEKSGDVKNRRISEKTQGVHPRTDFQTPLCFLEN
jgi:hypothetical protein